MLEQVSTARLNLLRVAYFLTFAFLAFQVWPGIIAGDRGWEPLAGVGVSFYAALSALCLLGLRYPLAMLPLIFIQLFYKIVWLLAVAVPRQFAGPGMSGGGPDLSVLFLVVVVLDLVVIPWPYVVARFVRARGDRWKSVLEQYQGKVGS
jgi:hypothetical protein